MNQFWVEDINKPVLFGDEYKHCIQVLRNKLNSTIRIFNGKGLLGIAYIKKVGDGIAELEVIKLDEIKQNYRLGLAFGILKNKERMEWMIEKCTELGVTDFYPLDCERSVKKNVNIKRLSNIAFEATKQVMSAHIPNIHEISTIEDAIKLSEYQLKLFAFCENNQSKSHITNRIDGNKILVCIGPEGDFTFNEAERMIDSGFHPVSLGNTRLRAETASIMVASIIKSNLDNA